MRTTSESASKDQCVLAEVFSQEGGSRLLSGARQDPKATLKQVMIAVLVAIITFLHYYTQLRAHHFHLFYQGLYFLPILLSGFWFGLTGGLITSLAITLLYAPFTVMYWNGFSASDFNNLMEMALYNLVASMLGIMRDRERAKQKRLVDSERLAAVGRAVSCLAHDMKTPLIAIGGFTRLVQRQISRECQCDFTPCIEKLDIVVKETQRLENMVKDMLDFAKPLQLCRSRGDISKVIEESTLLIEEQARERGVLLNVGSTQNLPVILYDSMRMKQVIINLITNAIQASPEGAMVAVHARTRGNTLMIDVMDNGCGIPPEKRDEVFLPFVSTKKEGTGLGLPIVQKIVEAHGGFVKVLDNPEGGLIFRVVLPLN